MDSQDEFDAFLNSAVAHAPGKEQVSMRLQSFMVDLAKRWADAEGKAYQEVLRTWTTKGLLDTLRESLTVHWYFHCLDNGKVHAGFETPRIIRYYREEEYGKPAALKASLDIWFGREDLGYLHAIASRLVDVAVATQNTMAKSRRHLRGSFFHVTRLPILALVEVRGNLGKDGTGFEAMDEALTGFESGAMTWVQRVIEQGVRTAPPGAGESDERETAMAAGALRALNERQSREGLGALRADLEELVKKGVVDQEGNRRRRSSTLEVLEGRSEVV